MTLHITANKQPLIFLDEELGVIDGQNTFCTVAAFPSCCLSRVLFIRLRHRLRRAVHPQRWESWRLVWGLRSHETDSWGLGHKRDAQFRGFIAKIALPPPGDSRLDRLIPLANSLPRRYLDVAAPVLMPGTLKAPPKQISPSLLLSQEGQTERTRGRFGLWPDGRSSKKHSAR